MFVDQFLCLTSILIVESYKKKYDFAHEAIEFVVFRYVLITAAHGITMWMLAPSQSFDLIQSSNHQIIKKIPNSIFEKSPKYKQYNITQRILSTINNLVNLLAIGIIIGTSISFLGNLNKVAHYKMVPEFCSSIPVPCITSSAIGLGCFMCLHINIMYQIINVVDRYAFEWSPSLSAYLVISTFFRAISHLISKGLGSEMLGPLKC